MVTLIVIPARYHSTRLPGKPLYPIAGRTLLARTIDVARRAATLLKGLELVVATDDQRVADHVAGLGVSAVMTDAGIGCGSDRAYAAALGRLRRPDFVINLQGDAPFTDPTTIVSLVQTLERVKEGVVTPVVQISWETLDQLRAVKAASATSGTTCVRKADGRALWFSKTIIPAIQDEARLRLSGGLSPIWQHIGVYGFTLEVLQRFAASPPGQYEVLEGLEQLRLLEIGAAILTIDVPPPKYPIFGIDTVEDAARAEALIHLHGDPMDYDASFGS